MPRIVSIPGTSENVTGFILKDRDESSGCSVVDRAQRNRRQVVNSHRIAHTPRCEEWR
jgi:hypothetical protein